MQIKRKTVMIWSSRKNKGAFFVTFILSEGNFLNICVLSLCIVYCITFYISKKKHYFIQFCCLFLKSLKAFIVSLNDLRETNFVLSTNYPNEDYRFVTDTFIKNVECYVPLKKRFIRGNEAPLMNKGPRQGIYTRSK